MAGITQKERHFCLPYNKYGTVQCILQYNIHVVQHSTAQYSTIQYSVFGLFVLFYCLFLQQIIIIKTIYCLTCWFILKQLDNPTSLSMSR